MSTRPINVGALTETVTHKADLDLGNIESGANINLAECSCNVTNGLITIPQDIKLELNNEIITFKVDSKVYIPKGFEEDGVTPKFDKVIIPEDVSWIPSITAKVRLGMYRDNNILDGIALDFIYSGDTSKMNSTTAYTYARFYNTDTNRIYAGNSDGGNWVEINDSLPICIFENNSSGEVISIKQVFNGFGYIGSTVFALPGVKGLIPNGRNPDGSLKNIEFTTASVTTRTFTWDISDSGQYLFIAANGYINSEGTNLPFYQQDKAPTANSYRYWYKPSENIMYATGSGTAWNKIYYMMFGKVVGDTSGKITSLTTKTAFRALDYTDFNECKLVDFQRPTSANNYTWYRLYSDGWVEQGGILPTVSTSANITVTLPIEMNGNSYNWAINCSYDYTEANPDWRSISAWDFTSTGFSIRNSTAIKKCWEVKGLAKV